MSFDAATWIQNTFFSLQHEYDPAKAREYYLKTRELKGRKKGQEKPPATVDKLPSWVTDTVEVEDTRNHLDKAPTSDAGALREAAAKRQAQLRARLDRLETVLAQLVEESAQAAGAETKDSKETAAKSKETEKSDSSKEEKPKTASEKKEAAKKAKEDYEKNKTSESNESDQALQDKIEEVQKKIADARESLRAAIERAKSMKPPTKPGASSTQAPKKPNGVAPDKPPKTAQAVVTSKKGDSQNGRR